MHWFAPWRFNGTRQPLSPSAVRGQLEPLGSRQERGRGRRSAIGATQGFVKQSDIAKTAKNPPLLSEHHVSFFDRANPVETIRH